jgi:fused signal recognition particle receptor
MFRRLFGGEERTEQEIQQEEQKIEKSVQKTRSGLFGRITTLFQSEDPITEELWEELEEVLIAGDVGAETSLGVVARVREQVAKKNLKKPSEARTLLKAELVKLLKVDTPQYSERSTKPYVVLVVGVNGVGKTTMIAKLANRYKNGMSKQVILAAADTFRAGAIEQLEHWAARVGVSIITQQAGSDPGAVAYDATQATYNQQADVLIIDTAGRLQNKHNLMKELEKISNVVKKRWQYAPHEVLLVIDATTGQNGLLQAKAFMQAANVTHVALTKLDGTAKGGIAFAIVQEIERPIKYIGTGETINDLALFDAEAFVNALFEEDHQ